LVKDIVTRYYELLHATLIDGMAMKKTCVITTIFTLFLTACSTTYSVNYIPAASIKGSGQVTVGTVHYLPFDQGEVDANQFQKAPGAIGDSYTSEPIPKLIKTALHKELIAGGFSVEPNAEIVIEAAVTRFLYDWLGFSEVDFYLDIDFKILKDGTLLFTHKTSAHKKAPKTVMAQRTETIRAAISNCIDDFFLEAHSKGHL